MAILSKLLGTFQTAFQIGKGGPKIKNNSSVIEIRNSGDSAYANFKAAEVAASTAVINGNAVIKATTADQIMFRNAADSADAIAFAADPATSDLQGLATVNYINNNPSAAANTTKSVFIATGNYATTYTSTATIADNAIITRVVVNVMSALDAGITLSIGTDEAAQASRFMTTGENDTQTADTYETTPFTFMKNGGGSGTVQKFKVTLSGTPTTGTVAIFFEYVVPTSW